MSSELQTHICICLPHTSMEMSNRYLRINMSKTKLLILLVRTYLFNSESFFNFSFKQMVYLFICSDKNIVFIPDICLLSYSCPVYWKSCYFTLKYIQKPITSHNFNFYHLDRKPVLLL